MLHRAIILLLWLVSVGTGSSLAHATEDFGKLMNGMAAGLRVAMSYARTGNAALAQIELDDARAALARLREGSAEPAPPFAPASLKQFIDAAAEASARAERALERGDGAAAAREIRLVRDRLHELRTGAGLEELQDCIYRLAPVMETLRVEAVAFQDARSSAAAVAEAGGRFGSHLARCRALAAPSLAGEGEFSRLFDGAGASAAAIGKAATAGDAALVHRYLIELQSFANLLDFRFG